MSIKIHYSFVFYIIILFFLNLLVYFIPFFISIIIHELIHGLFGVLYGLKIKNIIIGINGLSIVFDDFSLNIFKKIIILLSGPICNLFLAVILYVFNKDKYVFLIMANLIIFLINIIPIYPLDGGKIVFVIFNEYFKHTAIKKLIEKIYYFFTIIIILIIGYVCINHSNLQLFIIGIYFLNLTNKNNYENVIII